MKRAQSVAEQKFALRVYRAITVFVIVAMTESAPSQLVKALLMCSCEELKNKIPLKDTKDSPLSGNAITKHVSTNAAVGNILSQESTKSLLPAASVAVSSKEKNTKALHLCDSASTHS